MRRVLVLLGLLSLAACGQPGTPLSRAINALRAGDHDALLAAESDADAALKTAAGTDGDMCTLTVDDVRKYSEAERIKKLDDPELFRLPEEDRLVYAVDVAGVGPRVAINSPLRRAPLMRAMLDRDPDAYRNCPKAQNGFVATPEKAAAMDRSDDAELARSAALKNWIVDLRARVGEERFDEHMRSAADHLEANNFTGRWPAATEFYGEEQAPTLQEVRNSGP